MKKIFIALTIALSTMAASAQTVGISTYTGTDVSAYAGRTESVRATRMMFKGWNTISLPFSMTQEQLNETFGSDCRLEKLAGVSQSGSDIKLNFVDAKAEGFRANTPYILYYNREAGGVKININGTIVEDTPSQVTFTTQQGATVTMNGVKFAQEGTHLYGIRAIDNQEAKFVDVTDIPAKFYATRCYIEVTGAEGVKLTTTHNETTAATQAARTVKGSTATYDINGHRVNSSANGVKITSGKKVF